MNRCRYPCFVWFEIRMQTPAPIRNTDRGRALKGLTERQIRRREGILAAARELITKHGFDGVTMRELARDSGVTPKTLYSLFESKERLLLTAVEERYRYLYQMIDEAHFEHGIDRLFYIIETVAETTRKNAEYAKALAPILSQESVSPITAIRKAAYHRAVQQIADEGDFQDWVDVGLINKVVYQQIIMVGQSRWYAREAAKKSTMEMTTLDLALVLRSVTEGYTHARTTEVIKDIQVKVGNAARR